MSEIPEDDYGLTKQIETEEIAAPDLDYRPRASRDYRPAIGLIGCGGIAAQHLAAYRHAGYDVVALCDRNEAKVRDRQALYYPDATTYTDYRELLRRDDVEVVDITTYPRDRVAIVEAALEAGKHVLSQKPFVLDLDVGERLVDLADRKGVRLAVNQNGRWAPHFSYIRQAIATGLLGDINNVDMTVHWDHSWIIGTPFEDIHDLVLYDFAIHWFDLAAHFFGDNAPRRVYASTSRARGQGARPPMLAHAVIDFDKGQAGLAFNASVVYGQQDRTYVTGTRGTAISVGPSLSEQTVTIYTADGYATPALEGTWFREGFHGTMAELLGAIEDGREPVNGARANLRSLGLAFAAIASARDGITKVPGEVRQLPS
jgi:predicted dehydrogenase